jgi:toxin ParE1/3/4
MKVTYTRQAHASLREALELIKPKVSKEKLREVRKKIFDKADKLKDNPKMGQKEEYLQHLDKNHRRVIQSHYKIIYLVQKDRIIVTDIFDTRQDPDKMKS